MGAQGATKLLTFANVAPGATAQGWWNNANAEVYRLNAWPKAPPGVTGSAEIVEISSVVRGSPFERELHFSVKNTGTTVIDIDVWALWWNRTLGQMLDGIRAQFGVPALGGAIVTKHGIAVVDVVGIRKHGSSVTVDTGDSWHLGSDTKAMTATLLGLLAQKGVVGWDVTVAMAFPEWARTMKGMFKDATFERLMAHRSGILDQTDEETKALIDQTKSVPERRRDFAYLITHREHVGLAFSYQNLNFILAGAMLERCTGKSWEELMRTELFQPLGMTTAGFGAPGSANDLNQPYGHSDQSGQREASKGDNTHALGPAGTVHASLHDWAKFVRLHLDGSEGSLTLSSSSLCRLHTQFPTNSMDTTRYGWGWGMHDDDSGDLLLAHDGSNGLWYCSCHVIPKKNVGFLAVSNIGSDKNGSGGLACNKVIQELRSMHFTSE